MVHFYLKSSAVIRKCKNYQMMGIYNENNQEPVLNGKYIMFCNPNGVYIQFFAVENTYIREYLKQVLNLIYFRAIRLFYGTTEVTDSLLDHQQ